MSLTANLTPAYSTNLHVPFIVKKKKRLLVQLGTEIIPLKIEDIVLMYTENKIVFVLDKNGIKYMHNATLTDLEEQLDRTHFFRANRQYIVNLNYIKGFKSFQRVKLLVTLNVPTKHEIIVSQESAPAFKKWIAEEY